MKSSHWIPNSRVIIIIKQDNNFLKREFFLPDNKSKSKERKNLKGKLKITGHMKVTLHVTLFFVMRLTL